MCAGLTPHHRYTLRSNNSQQPTPNNQHPNQHPNHPNHPTTHQPTKQQTSKTPEGRSGVPLFVSFLWFSSSFSFFIYCVFSFSIFLDLFYFFRFFSFFLFFFLLAFLFIFCFFFACVYFHFLKVIHIRQVKGNAQPVATSTNQSFGVCKVNLATQKVATNKPTHKQTKRIPVGDHPLKLERYREDCSMVPAQEWHAQIEKCSQIFGVGGACRVIGECRSAPALLQSMDVCAGDLQLLWAGRNRPYDARRPTNTGGGRASPSARASFELVYRSAVSSVV